MHDGTLQRTTNVHEVFPNRTKTSASLFTWAELGILNAGAWFLSVSGLLQDVGKCPEVVLSTNNVPSVKLKQTSTGLQD